MTYELTDVRLRHFTLALAGGPLIALLLYLAIGEREQSSLFRGDFPAFYAAAEIVWSGHGAQLYDYALQRETENRHWPDFSGHFYIYAYPPFFALLLAPLAALPPLVAKALFSGILLACLIGALRLMHQASPFIQHHFAFSLVYLLTLAPLGISIVGGQNTALSILILALVFWSARTGHPWLMGLFASLLLYKPQFGVLLFVYLIAHGQRETLIGWGIGASCLYLLGIPVLGPSWPWAWVTQAAAFGDLNFGINNFNMISLAGMSYWLADHLVGEGTVGLTWGYWLSALGLLLTWFYMKGDALRLALIPYGILFFSP